MSETGKKCFIRPKVRFSKSAESPETLSSDHAFSKPKIRSISTLKYPIKILKAPSTNLELVRNSSPDTVLSRYSTNDTSNKSRSCLPKAGSTSVIDSMKITSNLKYRANDIIIPSNKRRTCEIIAGSEQRSATPPSILVQKKSLSANNVETCLKNSNISVSSLSDKTSKSLEKGGIAENEYSRTKSLVIGKENIPSRESMANAGWKVPNNTPRSTSDSGIKSTNTQKVRSNVEDKSLKFSNESTGLKFKTNEKKIMKPSEATKGVCKPGTNGQTTKGTKKNVEIKRSSVGLMPCMKFKKPSSNSVPMKKTIIRDASAYLPKVYVGPGIPRSKSPDTSDTRFSNEKKISRSRLDPGSADRLAHPEHNSIAGTIKKLRDAREEKIVEDLQHLPAIYRKLINGKVSSALDFGINEAIYRDLVDLTIDEKQLPSRLTRSKDPEPRERDIEPKLSDFFVPTNDEEFRTAVTVKLLSPRGFETWNPYGISDRILSWKESLDNNF